MKFTILCKNNAGTVNDFEPYVGHILWRGAKLVRMEPINIHVKHRHAPQTVMALRLDGNIFNYTSLRYNSRKFSTIVLGWKETYTL